MTSYTTFSISDKNKEEQSNANSNNKILLILFNIYTFINFKFIY